MSNDNTVKPTAWPVFVDRFCDVDEGYAVIAYNPDIGPRSPTRGMVAWFGTIAGATFENPDQCKANAELTAEAFNVHTETGLTPRQLAEQRDELLRIVDNIRKDCRRGAEKFGMSDAGVRDIAGRCDAIIAKVEAKP